jgi:hypothetical protein
VVDDLGEGDALLEEEGVGAGEEAQAGAGDAGSDPFEVRRWDDPVLAAAGRQGRDSQRTEVGEVRAAQ